MVWVSIIFPFLLLPALGSTAPARGKPSIPPAMTPLRPIGPVPAPPPLPNLPLSVPAQAKASPLLNVPKEEARPQVSFFFNDHDSLEHFQKELKAFLGENNEILVESLRQGPELSVFKSVSKGILTPSRARRLVRKRKESMDKPLLKALYRSGKGVLPESIYRPENRAARLRKDKELVPRAGDFMQEAFDAFAQKGDARQALKRLEPYNRAMAEVHALREEALLADLTRRLDSGRPAKIGVIIGLFHTWPYERLKAAGYNVNARFYPEAAQDPKRQMPYNRPLRKSRLLPGQPYTATDRKELLSFLVLYWMLGDRFQTAHYAADKDRVYNSLAARMRTADIRRLADELSAHYNARNWEDDARAFSGFTLRWLAREGFLLRSERKYFDFGP